MSSARLWRRGVRGSFVRACVWTAVLALCAAPHANARAASARRDLGFTPPITGLVVLQGDAFEFDAPACARLLPLDSAGPRVWIGVKGDVVSPRIDPFAQSGGSNAFVELDPLALDAGDDPTVAGQVDLARAVTLGGGDYLAWWILLTPSGKRSHLATSLLRAHRDGRLVAGQGAGAAFLAHRALVDRVSLQRERRNPRRTDPNIAVKGLGLIPSVLVETARRSEHRLTGMFDALLAGSVDVALYLDRDVAWVFDESGPVASVEGAGVALVFDASDARRQRNALREGRASLLASGDRFDTRARRVMNADRPFERNTNLGAVPRKIGATLEASEVGRALALLASPEVTQAIEIEGAVQRLSLWIDERSALRPAGDLEQRTRASVGFDLIGGLE